MFIENCHGIAFLFPSAENAHVYLFILSSELLDKQVVNQIKAESGSVIRYKKTENEDQHDENGYFIIGGKMNAIQICKVLFLLVLIEASFLFEFESICLME